MESTCNGKRPVVAHLSNSLGLGGTERQLIVELSALQSRYECAPMCLSKVGAFVEQLAKEGLEPEEFSLRGGLLRANTLLQVARIARRLRERNARLLHCHDFYSALVGSLAARATGVPYIVSRRDLGLDRSASKRRALAWASRAAPRVVCNALAVQRLVEREGVEPSRIVVIPNGLDLEAFDAAWAMAPGEDVPADVLNAPLIVLVGNMQLALKGHATFLQAAALVARKHPTARFALIGDGRLRPGLEEQARALGLERAVWFGGWRTDVEAILRHATVAVSASASEGLSNAILEAMAASVPVVATRVGGSPELVTDDIGFLVDPGDSDALAGRVNHLLASPALARQLGSNGRRRVERNHAAEHLGSRLGALYEELLNQGTTRAFAH